MKKSQDDSLWKLLDHFPEVEPHPQSRARFWARVAREETPKGPAFGMRWLVHFFLPAMITACVILALYLASHSFLEQRKVDREIAQNMDLYQNYDVIKNMAHLACYEKLQAENEPDPSEITE